MNKSKYRVWSSTNGKLRYYYVDNIENAILIINALIIRDVDDENVDFNAFGLEENNLGTYEEYYTENGLDIMEFMEDNDKSYNYMLGGKI